MRCKYSPAIVLERWTGRKALPVLDCRVQYFLSKNIPLRIDLINVISTRSQFAGVGVGSGCGWVLRLVPVKKWGQRTDARYPLLIWITWRGGPTSLGKFPQESHCVHSVVQISICIGVYFLVEFLPYILREILVCLGQDGCEVVDKHFPCVFVAVRLRSSVHDPRHEPLLTAYFDENLLNSCSTMSHRSSPLLMLSSASCFRTGMSYSGGCQCELIGATDKGSTLSASR